MKKFLSLLLAVMMLLSCIPAMAEANAEWKINKTTQLVARKSAAEKLEHIVVPSEVDGMAVRGLEYMCFNMYKNFAKLTLSDGLVMLDRSTTRDLPNLAEVELPDSLLIIREGNFTNLPKLTSVVVPASVSLVQSSFNKCKTLTSITFEGRCPVFVEEGTYGLFTELPADCVIYVPDNQVEAYKAALADRGDVVNRIQPSGQNAVTVDWTVPESEFEFDAATGTITGYTGTANRLEIPTAIGGVQVKHIAAWMNTPGYSLCYVVIPEGVETIGEYAFAGIKLLSYVSLPSTLTSVGESAFSGSYLSAIAYNGDAVPSYSAGAFQDFDSNWRMILPYGSAQEVVDGFAAYIAETAPKCVVRASIIEPYTFPALDAEAGAPFIGTWNAVAVFDGADYYGMDLLGLSMIVSLQADGTGVVDMDGDAAPGGWYVENGAVVFAPILAEGGQPVPEEAMTFTVDENGRMVLDLGGIYLLLELEGKTYAVPAIPEKPWPELEQSNAQSFIGTWEAVSYIVEGETYAAELMGKMMLNLNADGTAAVTEPGEEPYSLRWYADYGTAYAGPAMSALAKITFDGNGNIKMEQEGMTIVMAPYVEKKVIEGCDELLGDWYDDMGNQLTLVNDGTMTYTYASDGWVNEYKWDVVNGAAAVTEGNWAGAAIYMENGIVFVDNGEGIFQLFSVDGDLSAYYGEDEGYDMPEAMPIGPEGEPYFGTWTMDMGGMAMNLTLNQDGTCAMEIFGESEPGVWSVVDGKANVMGDELCIDGDGNLVMESEGMVFVRSEGGAAAGEMSEDEQLLALLAMLAEMEGLEGGEEAAQLPEQLQPYVGTWHMVYIATGGLEGDLRAMGLTAKLELNADGTGKLSGAADDSGKWYDDEGTVRFGQADTPLVLLDGGFLRYGSQLAGYMVFSQDEKAVWSPDPVVTEAPVMPSAPAASTAVGMDVLAGYTDKKFVAKTYTVGGFTSDASMLGAEYALTIYANNTCELSMAGFPMLLRWTQEQDRLVIDYMGAATYYATLTEAGIDLDMNGMVLNMVAN